MRSKLEDIHSQLSALTIRGDKYIGPSEFKYLVAQVIRVIEEIIRIEKAKGD